MRHPVPALGQQSTFLVRIHRPWHRHGGPTVGPNGSYARELFTWPTCKKKRLSPPKDTDRTVGSFSLGVVVIGQKRSEEGVSSPGGPPRCFSMFDLGCCVPTESEANGLKNRPTVGGISPSR